MKANLYLTDIILFYILTKRNINNLEKSFSLHLTDNMTLCKIILH